MVCKHNLHNYAVAVNGYKKDISDRCRGGYNPTNTINETYVNQLTDRVLYQHQHCDDLRIVPYRLVWAKKVSLSAICLVAGSASFGIRIN
jgi:hypothetical protein